jgi:hypothetical protein
MMHPFEARRFVGAGKSPVKHGCDKAQPSEAMTNFS